MAIGEMIFTVAEAAEFAKVPESVIRRWFDEGLKHMPTVSKVGKTGPRREIIRRSSLLAFIEAHEVGARIAQPIAGRPTPPSFRRESKFPDTNGLGTPKSSR